MPYYDQSLTEPPQAWVDPSTRQMDYSGNTTAMYLIIRTDTFGAKLVPESYFTDSRAANRALAAKLTEIHPAISVEENIFGGVPHIAGVRLSVGDVLAKLYVYGNIQEILDTYSPQVNEEQIKEAIAYAQDFLEMACDPDETTETDD